jgi:hypothetical protein
MYHSITFGDKNTWDDWHLFPSSRPVFNPPSPKVKYIDIPGGDGQLDLTESLRGDVNYGNREGSFEFIVDNGHEEWHQIYSKIMDYLHGQKMRAFLEDDPDYYYEGRFFVNQWKSDPHYSKIVISYIVDPYKMDRYSSTEDWEWDTFNFETDVARDYRDLEVLGSLELTIVGSRKPVIPLITVTSHDGNGLRYAHRGLESGIVTGIRLQEGTHRYPQIVYKGGETWVVITGYGTVTIDYRGGRL